MNKQLNMVCISNEVRAESPRRKSNRILFFFSMLVLLLSVGPMEESKADVVSYDPWYYVETNVYKFTVPDKFQHFYGSAMLSRFVGPMPAFALGVSKEVYDDSYAKVGFSIKDIAADFLGIMSAKFARTDKVSLWLNWSPTQETLVLQFGLRL